MDDIVIRVENLGKRYRIGTAANSYRTLRDGIVDAFARLTPDRRRPDGKGIFDQPDLGAAGHQFRGQRAARCWASSDAMGLARARC